MRFSRADRGRGRWCRRKYSFLRRRWSRRLERLSEASGDVGRRKRGFCLMRSVNCWDAVSGEWARARRVCAMCVVGAGEDVILEVFGLSAKGVRGVWRYLKALEVEGGVSAEVSWRWENCLMSTR